MFGEPMVQMAREGGSPSTCKHQWNLGRICDRLPSWPEELIPPPAPKYEPREIVTEPSPDQLEWAAEQLADLAEDMVETPEGRRWATLSCAAFQAGGMGAHGFLTQEQARDALVPAAEAAGLSSKEAAGTFTNGWNNGLLKPISQYPRNWDADDFDDDDDLIGSAGDV